MPTAPPPRTSSSASLLTRAVADAFAACAAPSLQPRDLCHLRQVSREMRAIVDHDGWAGAWQHVAGREGLLPDGPLPTTSVGLQAAARRQAPYANARRRVAPAMVDLALPPGIVDENTDPLLVLNADRSQATYTSITGRYRLRLDLVTGIGRMEHLQRGPRTPQSRGEGSTARAGAPAGPAIAPESHGALRQDERLVLPHPDRSQRWMIPYRADRLGVVSLSWSHGGERMAISLQGDHDYVAHLVDAATGTVATLRGLCAPAELSPQGSFAVTKKDRELVVHGTARGERLFSIPSSLLDVFAGALWAEDETRLVTRTKLIYLASPPPALRIIQDELPSLQRTEFWHLMSLGLMSGASKVCFVSQLICCMPDLLLSAVGDPTFLRDTLMLGSFASGLAVFVGLAIYTFRNKDANAAEARKVLRRLKLKHTVILPP